MVYTGFLYGSTDRAGGILAQYLTLGKWDSCFYKSPGTACTGLCAPSSATALYNECAECARVRSTSDANADKQRITGAEEGMSACAGRCVKRWSTALQPYDVRAGFSERATSSINSMQDVSKFW